MGKLQMSSQVFFCWNTIFATDDTIVCSNVFTGMHIIAFIDFSNGFHISITINHMGKPYTRYILNFVRPLVSLLKGPPQDFQCALYESYSYVALEIKPCKLSSRIRNMEAESLISW